ncbi:hypothetical protein [Dongia sp.]|uniref:hypothetical protein n=1 Tax=Dongia sp. TaxID=1977262 RepID=UPI0035ADD535
MAALSPASLDRFFLFFPDSWPKTRHAARRSINQENLELVASPRRIRLSYSFRLSDIRLIRINYELSKDFSYAFQNTVL